VSDAHDLKQTDEPDHRVAAYVVAVVVGLIAVVWMAIIAGRIFSQDDSSSINPTTTTIPASIYGHLGFPRKTWQPRVPPVGYHPGITRVLASMICHHPRETIKSLSA